MTTFIDIGARKKVQRNYNVNDNFRSALSGQPQNSQHASKKQNQNKNDQGENEDGSLGKKKTKGWKIQVGGAYDHQFFDVKKLDELEKIENTWIEF